MGSAIDVAHDESHTLGDGDFAFFDLGVPFLRGGVFNRSFDAGGETWGAWFAEGRENRGGKATVEGGAVDGGCDIET